MQIAIVGAGAIGRFLAVQLSATGSEVVLVDPAPVSRDELAAIEVNGLRSRPSSSLVISADPSAASRADVCIVAVKSAATEIVAESLARVLPAETVVVSFQNGLRNVDRLRERLGARAVGGVITYNVFREGEVAVQASSGHLLCGMLEGIGGHRLRQLRAAFRRAGQSLSLRDDIEAVIAGKLLLNLNNGVCAATGLSIRKSLRSRDARWCFARCLREGIFVLRAAGLRPARVTALPPRLIAAVMALPDAVVVRLAGSVIAVDPRARSSTLQDLDRGQPTEISELNGALVWLAERAGVGAPANRLVTEVVKEHEEAVRRGAAPRYRAASALRAALEASSRR